MSKATFQAGLSAGIVSGMRFPMVVEMVRLPDHCLTFSSAEPFTIAVGNAKKYWDGMLYYSTDATTWNEWDGLTSIASAAHNGDQKIYMRGIGNSNISSAEYGSRWVLTGNNIRCDGNIETLLDYEIVDSGQHPTMAHACYYYMFYGCTNLLNAPKLPATTLSGSCYYEMFHNCKSLVSAPELPATVLDLYCYLGMFYGCTSLVSAPKLPATTLARSCYYDMFRGCTSLVSAPKLPATTLAPTCYTRMFYKCTSLKISEKQTDEYLYEYRIPTSGNGITATKALENMFGGTGGTFTGTPSINTTYYTANEIV